MSQRPPGPRARLAPAGSAVLEPAQAFRELGRISVATQPLTVVLARVAELVRATVPGAGEVSVTLVEGGEPTSAASTGDLALQLDGRQYEQGFGPCMDAALSGVVIALPDLARDRDRYPDFASAAVRAGVTSVLSVGLPVPASVVGGINVYSLGDERLGEEAQPLVETFAGYAAVAVAGAGMLDPTARVVDDLRRATATRATIQQAKGILVARLGCSPEDAFRHLCSQSQQSDRTLGEVAAEVVASSQRVPRDASA